MERRVIEIYGEPKPYRPRVEGFVYFIQAEGGGPVKIGWAKRPKKRLSSIQTSHKDRLVIRKLVAARTEAEAKFHKRFAKSRLQGEWFEATPDLVAFMAAEISGAGEKRG